MNLPGRATSEKRPNRGGGEKGTFRTRTGEKKDWSKKVKCSIAERSRRKKD